MEFVLLGPVEAGVDLGPLRQRAVLAAVLLDTPVPVDRLAERVWGPDVPRTARRTLFSYLSRLRSAGVPLVRTPAGYLVSPSTVDVIEFRSLVAAGRFEEALALWRGEPFAELDSPWFTSMRATLYREREAAELELVDSALRAGTPIDLVGLAARCAERPLDERLAAQYLVALHRAGRTADALEHYRRTRQVLLDELGVEPGPLLCQRHVEVLGPQQLPARPLAFVARESDLARISAGRISVISGPGGVGKTWLALCWAHRGRFQDGSLYADLRGFDPARAPVSFEVVLRGFLVALGVAEPPASTDEQVALYRTITAGKQLLVVLDNARDAAQVVPLLPGASATVLVTSRNRLHGLVSGHGARAVPLAALGAEDARRVLRAHLGGGRRVVGADLGGEAGARRAPTADLGGEAGARRAPTADLGGKPGRHVAHRPRTAHPDPDPSTHWDEVADLCGGLPLALGIAAARAQAVPDLVRELREDRLGALDGGDLTANLRAVFSWSLRALDPNATEVFALLGRAPGPDVGVETVRAMAGRDVRTDLRRLEDAHLVEQHRPGRYRMHDLVRIHAAEQPARPDAHRRLVDHYLGTAFAADRHLQRYRLPIDITPRPAPADPLAWFAAEHDCLRATQQLAAELGWDEDVWRLAWVQDGYHSWRGLLLDARAAWTEGLQAAERLDDRQARHLGHRALAIAHSQLGDTEAASEHLDRAMEHADGINVTHTEFSIARVAAHRGDYAKALKLAERGLKAYEQAGNDLWLALAHTAVGWFSVQLGSTDDTHILRAITLFQEHDDLIGEAENLGNLGHLRAVQGREDESLGLYQRSLELMRRADSPFGEAITLEEMGHALKLLGRDPSAAYAEAVELYRAQYRMHKVLALG
ncbi:BTAD domain-containing putative transcriptional regulator [Lentzea sp. NPDC051213]|uniref:AfsR/SARP family transcriptional regulator n=1 Tax=Lentzea sp. NPDC051213 TaxID=3364126 RepID=UPI0037B1F444